MDSEGLNELGRIDNISASFLRLITGIERAFMLTPEKNSAALYGFEGVGCFSFSIISGRVSESVEEGK